MIVLIVLTPRSGSANRLLQQQQQHTFYLMGCAIQANHPLHFTERHMITRLKTMHVVLKSSHHSRVGLTMQLCRWNRIKCSNHCHHKQTTDFCYVWNESIPGFFSSLIHNRELISKVTKSPTEYTSHFTRNKLNNNTVDKISNAYSFKLTTVQSVHSSSIYDNSRDVPLFVVSLNDRIHQLSSAVELEPPLEQHTGMKHSNVTINILHVWVCVCFIQNGKNSQKAWSSRYPA